MTSNASTGSAVGTPRTSRSKVRDRRNGAARRPSSFEDSSRSPRLSNRSTKLIDRHPPAGLAAILDEPSAESKLALYASGDQLFLREVFPFYEPEAAQGDARVLLERLPRLLGKWLRLSILRFPGLLVNEKAAASYLNIAVDDFASTEIRELFEPARYLGPFSDLSGWWWREELDLLLGCNSADDGRQYAEQHDHRVDECLDPQDSRRAGYYCMLTREPVSRENSRGGVSWFPQGADLARIRKDRFDTLTSLVGRF